MSVGEGERLAKAAYRFFASLFLREARHTEMKLEMKRGRDGIILLAGLVQQPFAERV
jgi:hypothetical protein